ncbi:unnamed protein product [Tuber aestivum]|uniref:Uncharacterized protein n=1 Tax=Tuber aestivum TaxID=59557 RepID=A0A292PQ12_9PEZI|nr:unnamed protein product [Tuber aestivum]
MAHLVKIYTQAIHSNTASPAPYSNRSAALLSLNKLPLALNDVNQAIKLDPTWSNAYRRKVGVLKAQQELDKAKVVFEESLKVGLVDLKSGPAEKQKEEAEIKKSIKTIDKIEERPSYHEHIMKDTEDAVGQRAMREFERRYTAGEPMGSWPPNGTCLRRIWITYVSHHMTIDYLLNVVVKCNFKTHSQASSSTRNDKCQYQLEQHQRNAIDPDLSPKYTIITYNKHLSQLLQSGPMIDNSRAIFHMGSARPVSEWGLIRPVL